MELSDFMEGIRTCPNHLLKEEWGIYDNFPVLLRTDCEQLKRKFRETNKFTEWEENRRHLRYLLGDVVLQITPRTFKYVTTVGWTKSAEASEHSERQLRDYSVTLSLHSIDTTIKEILTMCRAMVNVMEVIYEIITAEKITGCLPWVGTRHHSPENIPDLSRIVYF
ncbi:MAG: hypothetical protein AABX04_04055 [Nanoarchaeota archaeon]